MPLITFLLLFFSFSPLISICVSSLHSIESISIELISIFFPIPKFTLHAKRARRNKKDLRVVLYLLLVFTLYSRSEMYTSNLLIGAIVLIDLIINSLVSHYIPSTLKSIIIGAIINAAFVCL